MRSLRRATETISMTARGWQQLALFLALIGGFVVRAEPAAFGGAQGGSILPPPRSGLIPIHQPALEELEPTVREQLISLQNLLTTQAKDSSTTDLKLSDAYGLMGQVYQAYSLTAPAKECYLNAHHLAPKDFRWT